jgi:hypothetical protein
MRQCALSLAPGNLSGGGWLQGVTSPEAAAEVQRAQQEAGTVLAAAKAQAADLESQLEVGTLH